MALTFSLKARLHLSELDELVEVQDVNFEIRRSLFAPV